VVGVSAIFADPRDLQLEAGRFVLPEDQSRAIRVAVLGAAVARDLFRADSPVGERISGAPWRHRDDRAAPLGP